MLLIKNDLPNFLSSSLVATLRTGSNTSSTLTPSKSTTNMASIKSVPGGGSSNNVKKKTITKKF